MSERKLKEDLIDKFLREALSEEELVAFQEFWDNDPQFVKDVQEYSRLKVALTAARRLDKDESRFGIANHLRKAFYGHQAVAAILLLAVMLPLYLLLQGQKRVISPESPEVKQLANTYFVGDRLENIQLDGQKGKLANLLSEKYDGNISAAIEKLNEDSISLSPLLLGDLYFVNNQQMKALDYYNQGLSVVEDDSLGYWNRLMTQLWLGQLIDVKKELREFSERDNSSYQHQSNEILEQLD